MSNYHFQDKRISLKAKGLLSQMLSLPEDWDYTLTGLASINMEGIDAIRSGIIELENAGYIRRSRVRDKKGCLRGTEYVIYERPQLGDEMEIVEVRKPRNAKASKKAKAAEETSSALPILAEPVSDFPVQAQTTQLNTKQQNTKKQITDSYLIRSAAEPPEPKGWDADLQSRYRELICENIEYDALLQDNPHDAETLQDITDILVDTVTANRKTTRVAGSSYSHEQVKSRLLKLNRAHIQYALDCFRENTTEVRNIRQYLLAVLYNAPSTMHSYYDARARHDLYGDRR